jgi:ribonuclease Z
MSSGSLTCLGVGDGQPCNDRHHNAFLLRFGGSVLLLDCGEPASSKLFAAGAKPDGVDRVFLSHMHADHIGGFLMLIQSFWLKGRTRKLTVHAPAEGIQSLKQMVEGAMLFEELLPFRLNFEPLKSEAVIRLGQARITPVANSHLNGFRQRFQKSHRRPFEAFSFLIASGSRRVVYSADIGQVADLEPLLHRPVDLLICELAHVEPEVLFRYLRSKAVRRVAFVHLSRENWSRLTALRRKARRALPGCDVVFPHDGQVIDF